MDILITGHTGFIGQHMAERLKNHNLYFLEGDIRDFASVRDQVATAQPDVIVHLAARTEVEKSFYEQTEFSEVNYVGTVNLIEAARSAPDAHFVFASTMEVYGHQPQSDQVHSGQLVPGAKPQPFDEQTVPYPNAPYAVAKLGCEKYLEYASRTYGMPYTILRQTNTYGRKDNDFFVIEQIITQMLQGDTVNLGYRLPWRNFLYIDDLLDAWELIITNPEKCRNRLYTLGPDNALPIWELADMIGTKLGWTGTINWDTKPKRPGEIYYLGSTHDLITQDLGWSPQVSLDRGLDLTIDHWREKLAK